VALTKNTTITSSPPNPQHNSAAPITPTSPSSSTPPSSLDPQRDLDVTAHERSNVTQANLVKRGSSTDNTADGIGPLSLPTAVDVKEGAVKQGKEHTVITRSTLTPPSSPVDIDTLGHLRSTSSADSVYTDVDGEARFEHGSSTSALSNDDTNLINIIDSSQMEVIADGRCSVASILLALKLIPTRHVNNKERATIDAARVDIGRSMDQWTEDQWISEVPVSLRMSASKELGRVSGSSFANYRQLLTFASPTTWLDHSIFYLASRHYQVGIIIVVQAKGLVPWYCRLIGSHHDNQIVLYHKNANHYVCIQLDNTRVFPSSHPIIARLVDLNRTHPPKSFKENDLDTAQRDKKPRQTASPPSLSPPEDSSPEPPLVQTSAEADSSVIPPFSDTPRRRGRPKGSKNKAPSKKNQPAPTVKPQPEIQPPRIIPSLRHPPSIISSSSHATLTVKEIAQHGQLFDHISFTNIPQWIGVNIPAWNAYRVASQSGDRDAQHKALVDILHLAALVLTQNKRGGKGSFARVKRMVKARCLTVGEKLRNKWECNIPSDRNPDLPIVLDKVALSTSPTLSSQSFPPLSSSRTDSEAEPNSGENQEEELPLTQTSSFLHSPSRDSSVSSTASTVAVDWERDGREECTDNTIDIGVSDTQAFLQQLHQDGDAEVSAIRRAKYHVSNGHMRKAAQVLHSTATMTDLTDPANRAQMAELHPPLPPSSILPGLPHNSREVIIEDCEVVRSIIRSSNNGSASGPSGWGGNMLSTLAESPICMAGIIALLKDIINGNIPAESRPYLLACRLVGLNKNGGGIRPIAIGEVFYRLAAVIAVKKVVLQAADLLSPHQYGVGVSSGAERILHSMQHTLADKKLKYAALKVDCSNAFNSCDRARMLKELYATPQLASLFRIADFAYSTSSMLLLERCEGDHIESSNGVRQGDPLSSLLFCLYVRSMYAQLAEKADVTLYGFIDDLHIVGQPAEVIKAFTAVQSLMPEVGLQFNTKKSQLAYFHNDTAPLHRSTLDLLAKHDISPREQFMEVMGAVVGRDEEAVKEGMREVLGPSHHSTFFSRLLSNVLPIQHAMLILRQCAVPQLNYVMRCVPPPCIADEAAQFDEMTIRTALDKLTITEQERTPEQTRILQAKLNRGGFGLTSAVSTSPAAYLGSLAAIADVKVFAPYTSVTTPLPTNTLLHHCIDVSMKQVTDATPSSAKDLPSSPSLFFHHFTNQSTAISSSLQSTLSLQAHQHSHDASLTSARMMKKQDGGMKLAHVLAYSAPQASQWKTAVPTTGLTTLTDRQFILSARLNLGLSPFDPVQMRAIGPDCPSCPKSKDEKKDNGKNAIADNPWHFLFCKREQGASGESTQRHHAVADALYHTVMTIGGRAVREPTHLESNSGKRPDLQIIFEGHHIITDIVISHPITTNYCASRSGLSGQAGVARRMESRKTTKYMALTERQNADFYAFGAESCGGLGPRALALLKQLSQVGEAHLAMWPQHQIVQHMLSSVAVAIQRGNALIVLSGYTNELMKRPKKGSVERGAQAA